MTLHVDDVPFLPEPTSCDVPEIGEAARQRACAREDERRPETGDRRLPLARARKIAEHVSAALQPFCTRIEIAGSIRRGRPDCGDVDLVVLAHDFDGMIARMRQSCEIKTSGSLNTIAVMRDGFQIDVFAARHATVELFGREPSNWGTLLLCRTGSKQFNIWLANQAKSKALHWNPYRGVCKGGSLTGEVIASETEEDIFRAIGLDWIKPEDREK